jgi:transmembrane sensor
VSTVRRLFGTAETRRREQACWWFARLQEPDLSLRLLKRWKKWESDPDNRRMFDEIVKLGVRLRIARPLLSIPITTDRDEGYDGSVSVHAWRQEQVQRTRARQRLRHAAVALGLIAAVVVAVVGLRWMAPTEWRTLTGGARMFVVETGLAEHREVVLNDGSKISLGAKTAITSDITAERRTVVLSRGEALFHVARDPQRPFRVIAGGGTITAVGTAFNVRRRDDDHVVVTVTEGTVEVTPGRSLSETAEPARAESEVALQRLTRGQELTYDVQGRFDAPRFVDGDVLSSWQNGQLRYRGELLRNVIPDVNRYSRRPLILGDKAAGDLVYSGTVFERDVDEWIEGLERIYPEVEVSVTDGQHILIRTRPTQADLQQQH